MAVKAKSEFVVIKFSYTYATCKTCDGEGVLRRTFRKMNFVEDCPACKGEGRQQFKVTSEVPLVEALKELGFTNKE